VIIGKVKSYNVYQETYNRTNWSSTRKLIAAGMPMGYRDVRTYGTGKYYKRQRPIKNYNSNGVLDGEQSYRLLSEHVKLNYENGILTSKISYDKDNTVIDSMDYNNKIWKINQKFKKNDGTLVISDPEFDKSEIIDDADLYEI
jgi:hypothetical protein